MALPATAEAVYALLQANVESAGGEIRARETVTRILRDCGFTGQPEVVQGKTPDGRAARLYVWHSPGAGTGWHQLRLGTGIVLATGTNIEPQVFALFDPAAARVNPSGVIRTRRGDFVFADPQQPQARANGKGLSVGQNLSTATQNALHKKLYNAEVGTVLAFKTTWAMKTHAPDFGADTWTFRFVMPGQQLGQASGSKGKPLTSEEVATIIDANQPHATIVLRVGAGLVGVPPSFAEMLDEMPAIYTEFEKKHPGVLAAAGLQNFGVSMVEAPKAKPAQAVKAPGAPAASAPPAMPYKWDDIAKLRVGLRVDSPAVRDQIEKEAPPGSIVWSTMFAPDGRPIVKTATAGEWYDPIGEMNLYVIGSMPWIIKLFPEGSGYEVNGRKKRAGWILDALDVIDDTFPGGLGNLLGHDVADVVMDLESIAGIAAKPKAAEAAKPAAKPAAAKSEIRVYHDAIYFGPLIDEPDKALRFEKGKVEIAYFPLTPPADKTYETAVRAKSDEAGVAADVVLFKVDVSGLDRGVARALYRGFRDLPYASWVVEGNALRGLLRGAPAGCVIAAKPKSGAPLFAWRSDIGTDTEPLKGWETPGVWSIQDVYVGATRMVLLAMPEASIDPPKPTTAVDAWQMSSGSTLADTLVVPTADLVMPLVDADAAWSGGAGAAVAVGATSTTPAELKVYTPKIEHWTAPGDVPKTEPMPNEANDYVFSIASMQSSPQWPEAPAFVATRLFAVKIPGVGSGSHKGATYEDATTGRRYYVKWPTGEGTPEQLVASEAAASAIYQLYARTTAVDARPIRFPRPHQGEMVPAIISPLLDPKDWTGAPATEPVGKLIQSTFWVDVLLGNYDVYGLPDAPNVFWNGSAEARRIDFGASLFFNAKGSWKQVGSMKAKQFTRRLRFSDIYDSGSIGGVLLNGLKLDSRGAPEGAVAFLQMAMLPVVRAIRDAGFSLKDAKDLAAALRTRALSMVLSLPYQPRGAPVAVAPFSLLGARVSSGVWKGDWIVTAPVSTALWDIQDTSSTGATGVSATGSVAHDLPTSAALALSNLDFVDSVERKQVFAGLQAVLNTLAPYTTGSVDAAAVYDDYEGAGDDLFSSWKSPAIPFPGLKLSGGGAVKPVEYMEAPAEPVAAPAPEPMSFADSPELAKTTPLAMDPNEKGAPLSVVAPALAAVFGGASRLMPVSIHPEWFLTFPTAGTLPTIAAIDATTGRVYWGRNKQGKMAWQTALSGTLTPTALSGGPWLYIWLGTDTAFINNVIFVADENVAELVLVDAANMASGWKSPAKTVSTKMKTYGSMVEGAILAVYVEHGEVKLDSIMRYGPGGAWDQYDFGKGKFSRKEDAPDEQFAEWVNNNAVAILRLFPKPGAADIDNMIPGSLHGAAQFLWNKVTQVVAKGIGTGVAPATAPAAAGPVVGAIAHAADASANKDAWQWTVVYAPASYPNDLLIFANTKWYRVSPYGQWLHIVAEAKVDGGKIVAKFEGEPTTDAISTVWKKAKATSGEPTSPGGPKIGAAYVTGDAKSFWQWTVVYSPAVPDSLLIYDVGSWYPVSPQGIFGVKPVSEGHVSGGTILAQHMAKPTTPQIEELWKRAMLTAAPGAAAPAAAEPTDQADVVVVPLIMQDTQILLWRHADKGVLTLPRGPIKSTDSSQKAAERLMETLRWRLKNVEWTSTELRATFPDSSETVLLPVGRVPIGTPAPATCVWVDRRELAAAGTPMKPMVEWRPKLDDFVSAGLFRRTGSTNLTSLLATFAENADAWLAAPAEGVHWIHALKSLRDAKEHDRHGVPLRGDVNAPPVRANRARPAALVQIRRNGAPRVPGLTAADEMRLGLLGLPVDAMLPRGRVRRNPAGTLEITNDQAEVLARLTALAAELMGTPASRKYGASEANNALARVKESSQYDTENRGYVAWLRLLVLARAAGLWADRLDPGARTVYRALSVDLMHHIDAEDVSHSFTPSPGTHAQVEALRMIGAKVPAGTSIGAVAKLWLTAQSKGPVGLTRTRIGAGWGWVPTKLEMLTPPNRDEFTSNYTAENVGVVEYGKRTPYPDWAAIEWANVEGLEVWLSPWRYSDFTYVHWTGQRGAYSGGSTLLRARADQPGFILVPGVMLYGAPKYESEREVGYVVMDTSTPLRCEIIQSEDARLTRAQMNAWALARPAYPSNEMPGDNEVLARFNPRARANRANQAAARESAVQTLIFPRTFSVRRAQAWAAEHGYRIVSIESSWRDLRARVAHASSFDRGSFAIEPLDDGVKAIVGTRRV